MMNRGAGLVLFFMFLVFLGVQSVAASENVKCGVLGGFFCSPNSCQDNGGNEYKVVVEGLFGKCFREGVSFSPTSGAVTRDIVLDESYLATGCEADVIINVDTTTEPFYVIEERFPAGINIVSTDGDTRTEGTVKKVVYDSDGNPVPDGRLNLRISSDTPGNYEFTGVYTLGSSVVNSIAGEGGAGNGLSILEPVCGDGVATCNEQCDDGNLVSGDGCESNCRPTPAIQCGNGVVEGLEECDDGDSDNSDYCSNECKTNRYYRIYATSGSLSGKMVYGGYTGIAAADRLCNVEARNSGLNQYSKWKAFLSNNTADIDYSFKNVRHYSYKTGNLNLVARNFDDLVDGDIISKVTHFNGALGSGNVWTGTGIGGISSGANCDNWKSDTLKFQGSYGDLTQTTSAWINSGNTACGQQLKVYCVEQPWCGNGIVDQASELCDDGNNIGGDGCSSVCNYGSGTGTGEPKDIKPGDLFEGANTA